MYVFTESQARLGRAQPAATLRQRWVLARALRPGCRAPARECSQVREQAPPRLELGRGCLCLALALQGTARGQFKSSFIMCLWHQQGRSVKQKL